MSEGPITPDEVGTAQERYLPPEVFSVFNSLIAAHWTGSSATVPQKEAIAGIMNRLDCSRDAVFVQHYLDVEEAYRNKGWSVHYDKPAYNENYEPTFTFKRRSK